MRCTFLAPAQFAVAIVLLLIGSVAYLTQEDTVLITVDEADREIMMNGSEGSREITFALHNHSYKSVRIVGFELC